MTINKDLMSKIMTHFYQKDLAGIASICAHPPRHHNQQELMHYCLDEALKRKWVNKPLFISTLLNRGLQLEYAEQGKTLLGRAVCDNNLELTNIILDAGANPNNADQDHMLPLSHALDKHQNIAIIRALLDAGANPLLPGKSILFGETAYEISKNRAQIASCTEKAASEKEIFDLISKVVSENPDYYRQAELEKKKAEAEHRTVSEHMRTIAKKPLTLKRRSGPK